ncbi:MAG: hypothetical protein EPN31_15985 [Castellaniella sp.]|nr:MAG: hypothetical protein EPN31_15985 [Castellaniella sp.]
MDEVQHNLEKTIKAIGGVQRLIPHVKTHRAPWLVNYQIQHGVSAFKAATPREVEMVLDAGAPEVVWAYPTATPANIGRVMDAAKQHPHAKVVGLIDSAAGLAEWKNQLSRSPLLNVRLRVDLDPGMGRTGAPMSDAALELARSINEMERFDGWHLYDGHIKDPDRDIRIAKVAEIRDKVRGLVAAGLRETGCGDLIAGGSYSFELWPADEAARVSPGSWIFSSWEHQADLPHLGWQVGAYVLSSVVSAHDGTVTLDAGSKAISPDMPMPTRFVGGGVKIVAMKEEHSVVESHTLKVGDLVALVPRHACTTAYLYDKALVRTQSGEWQIRPQLGNER